jgi:hypothetical protein
MYYATDRQTAARVLTDLRHSRLDDRATALATLQRIRNEAACERTGDQLRMQAWIAIRNLYDAAKAAPERDLKSLWQDAIAKTVAWQQSMG